LHKGQRCGHHRIALRQRAEAYTVNNSVYGPTGLPVICSDITVVGNNSTIRRPGTAPDFRILAVGKTGHLRLQEAAISGGLAALTPESDKEGGRIYNHGALTLVESTISGNRAGGGLFNNYGEVTLIRSTISDNRSTPSGNGGGVFNGGFAGLRLISTLISGNHAPTVSAV
jgi:hypothetical protein